MLVMGHVLAHPLILHVMRIATALVSHGVMHGHSHRITEYARIVIALAQDIKVAWIVYAKTNTSVILLAKE